MRFRKIDDTKFQCILYKEDMVNFNISMEDFLRNDASKIHELLDIVIEKAYEQIGVDMDGTVMSLQLVPQPNHSLLLTVSGKKEDAFEKRITESMFEDIGDFMAQGAKEAGAITQNAVDRTIVFRFDSMEDIEDFCITIPSTKGIFTALYKSPYDDYFMIVERKGLSSEKFFSFITGILEYSELYTSDALEITAVREHCEEIFKTNAIGNIKKYCA